MLLVKAVPCEATAVLKPPRWHRMQSICPSTSSARRASRISRLALSSPNKMRLLRNTGVSGVLTYLPPALSSAFKMRPLNPTARPSSSRIVNITRSRNRS
jgi:hypothetical protein